jgi:histidyl-tRNA synthetase
MSSPKFTSPVGTEDFLPKDHRHFNFVKSILKHRFRQAGFKRIDLPVFEDAELFHESLGVDTEIIKRELFTFDDPRGKNSYSLRPELTTGIVRSFIEHEMYNEALPVELYNIGRCFRFERPQSRTKREFRQIGCEILGETDPAIDAQIIYLGHRILSDLNIIDRCELKINTIGNREDRTKFLSALESFYAGKERSLSPRSREKLEQKKYLELLNPLTENEEILASMAPKITDYLSPESKAFFEQMLTYLNSFGIEYTMSPGLVRPLDYYTHTVFEFREKNSKNKILVGGRYDGLIKKLGGPDLGGCGFAAGAERLIGIMQEQGVEIPYSESLQIFVAATGVIAKKEALPLLVQLREHGFNAVGVLGKTKMEDQLNRARKFNVPYTILMGDLEARNNEVLVRDMEKGKSTKISLDNIVSHMEELLGKPPKFESIDDYLAKMQKKKF